MFGTSPFRAVLRIFSLVGLLFVMSGGRSAWAATVSAASCSTADIQAAIASASAGSTVTVPAGTCVWSTVLSINKAITLQGSGVGSTIIKDAVQTGPLLAWTCVANGTHRMTGFEFRDGGRVNQEYNAVVGLYCTSAGTTKFRVDHNKFDHLNGVAIAPWDVIGVIDHNTFLTYPTRIPLYIYHNSWKGVGSYGDNSWTQDVTWGSSDFLFVEDNTIAYDAGTTYACWDGFRGTRAVARFNTLIRCAFETHGTESGGRNRGGRAVEIYHNSADATGTVTTLMADIRSGGALIWSNTLDNVAPGYPIAVANLVDDRTVYPFAPWGPADGTNVWDANGVTVQNRTASSGATRSVTVSGAGWTANQWTGYIIKKTSPCTTTQCSSVITSNTADTISFLDTSGFPGTPLSFVGGETFSINSVRETLDQPGRGGGALLAGDPPTSPTGTNDQVDFPVYEWLNTSSGTSIHMGIHSNCAATCRPNEHYYNATATFNGTSGVGAGPLANRPATCTAGVWYWATDEGEWWSANSGADGRGYKCTATNTWSLYYTPYTYPHPLTTASGSTASADTTAPVPGNAGLIASSVTSGSATLNWTRATDDTSLQSALQYEVRLSTSSDIDTVAKAEAYGAIVKSYTTDISTASISGLTAGLTYYFNVITRDEAGNKSIYAITGATAPVVVSDTTPPVPGNSGTLTSTSTSSSVTLGWTKATDLVSAQSVLQYEVRRSSSNNIDTVTRAEANGTIAQVYMADIGSANISGLSAGATYYFNVIVKDAAGNKAVYVTKSATTAAGADTTAPTPGNGGAITSSNIGSSTVTLNWTRATDNVSTQSQLLYEVRRSSSNNIDTVTRAEAYGTIVQPYAADIASANISGLSGSTTYYFNVVVKDAVGNRAVYLTQSVTTAAPLDTSAPVPGNSGAIAIAGVGAGSVTLSWTKATDNASAQSQLMYEVRRSSSNNIDTVTRAEANGAIVQAYAADVASAVVAGLSPSTSYFFNVIVKDGTGNKAVYLTTSVTTNADTIPPAPGGSGLMTSNANSSSITLNWVKATDNASVPSALKYEIRLSTSDNISTVSAAEANGAVVKPYTADINSFVVSGLASATTYYLNVIVMDGSQNKSAYLTRMDTTGGKQLTQVTPNGKGPVRKADDPVAPVSVGSTSSDTTPPIPGSAGLITVSGVSSTGLTLRWTTATDDTSPAAALQYQVVESSTRNLSTVSDAESNGNVLLAYSADTSSYAVRGLKSASQHFFTVIVKDGAGNKAVYGTAGNLGDLYTFLPNGGTSVKTASAATSPLKISQVQISPAVGTVIPAGLAIVRNAGSRGVISTAGLPLLGGIRGGSLYADLLPATDTAEAVRTGIALSNPSIQDSEISFFFTDATGVELKSGVYTLLAGHQISGFLDESPFNGPGSFRGTFTFSSSAPISAVGTRSVTQRTGDSLLESLPIATEGIMGNNAMLPLFVDGGGWSTAIVLRNSSSSVQTGTVQFWGPGSPGAAAQPIEMTINGGAASTFSYSLPPRSVVRLVTPGTNGSIQSGSVRISANIGPFASGGIPDAVAIVSLKNNGVTISEASLAALPLGTAFRSYVETSSNPEWVSSSFAIANASDNPNTLSLTLTQLDGTPVGSTSVTLPQNGQIAQFVVDLFPGLPDGFRGLLRVSASAPISVAGLHTMYNASGDFLIASTPALNEATPLASTGVAFPLVATGAGYDTQLVLFGQSGQSGSGELTVVSRDGVPQISSSVGIVP